MAAGNDWGGGGSLVVAIAGGEEPKTPVYRVGPPQTYVLDKFQHLADGFSKILEL